MKIGYEFIDLGPVDSIKRVNNRGEVVGNGFTQSPHPRLVPFVWHPGTGMEYLEVDPETKFPFDPHAENMNDRGQVVGGWKHTLMWLWDAGQVIPIGGSDDVGVARSINDAGHVAGTWSCWKTSEGNGEATTLEMQAFIWERGRGFRLLETTEGCQSEAWDTNSNGDVVGFWELQPTFLPSPSWSRHACLWANGKCVDLIPEARECQADCINDNEQIVGTVRGFDQDLRQAVTRAFLWERGMVYLLDAPSGSIWASAREINGSGLVVGQSHLPDGPMLALLWENGALRDLRDMVAPDDRWRSATAESINDLGQIVGVIHDTYPGRGFLLTPL